MTSRADFAIVATTAESDTTNIQYERLGAEVDEKELKQRTKDFAHRCVKLALSLPKTQLGRHIAG
jgi:hypothetical protein